MWVQWDDTLQVDLNDAFLTHLSCCRFECNVASISFPHFFLLFLIYFFFHLFQNQQAFMTKCPHLSIPMSTPPGCLYSPSSLEMHRLCFNVAHT